MKKTLKSDAFKKHREMIEWLWLAGKGIMFRHHLERYFLCFGTTKYQIRKAIKELIDTQLIESFKFHHYQVLKLKKYSIYTLSKKEREEISAVRYSSTALVRSAFLQERFLKILEAEPKFHGKGSSSFLRMLKKQSTCLYREKQSYQFLIAMEQRERAWPNDGLILSPLAQEEIKTMQLLRRYAEHGEGEEAILELRKRRALDSSGEQSITLNNLIAQNIHLWLRKSKEGHYYLQVDIFDVKSAMSPQQFSRKLEMVHRYLINVFETGIRFEFNLLCSNLERTNKFSNKMEETTQQLCQRNGWYEIDIKVINLNIDRILFKGATIIN